MILEEMNIRLVLGGAEGVKVNFVLGGMQRGVM